VTTLVRALPDVARAFARLVRDPVLPRSIKLALAAAVVYLVSPIDVIPDVAPLVGYVDDLLLGAIIVDGILSRVDRRLVLRYWPGSPRSLDRVARAARLLSAWVPGRLKRRLFAPGR
jgi:uncharacterized membrane protein YkvA (DUF1232 family)